MKRVVRLGMAWGFLMVVVLLFAAQAWAEPAGYSQYRGGTQANPRSSPSPRSASTSSHPGGASPQGRFNYSSTQARPAVGPARPSGTAGPDTGATARTAVPPKPTAEPPAAQTGSGSEKASSPSVADALRLVPTQKDVDYSHPSPEEAVQCKISAQKVAGAVGWVIEDSRGNLLRRFLDTNGDGKVDQWCYYKDGLEVYRDVDSDFDSKVDQCRWCSTGGTRWGVDRDQDGTIDAWRSISAEEVTREIVRALITRDPDRFARVLLSEEELRSLGLGEAKAGELAAKVNGAAAKFKAMAAQQKLVTVESQWTQFSASQPGVVPAGTEGSTKDVEVYEGVMAIVRSGSDHGQIPIGTLVKVGNAWKAIDCPHAGAEGAPEMVAAGFFFRSPTASRPQVAAGAPSEKTQAMLTELEKLDASVNGASDAETQASLNAKRADLLERLASEAGKPEERAAWVHQMADMVSAAVQSGGYPDGVQRLATLLERLRKNEDDAELVGYVRFRQLTAEYGLAMQARGADFAKIQTDWLKKLEQYVVDYPKSPDAAEAMLQLALAQEFAGQEDEAKKWYGQIVSDFPQSPVAKKAAGARHRLESVGKTIDVQGKGPDGELVELAKFRGKTVVIQYWATWCEPCKADMAVLKDLVEKYGNSGFAVLGVNLDNDAQAMAAFLTENKLPWTHLREEGGLDSRPAVELGILTLPTMILVDSEGKVVHRNIGTSELVGELKKLIR